MDTYIRNAKFWGIQKTPEFNRAMQHTISVQNALIKKLTDELKSGSITSLDKFSIHYSDGSEVTLAQYCDNIRYIFGTDKHKSVCRSVLMYVVERLRSYLQRNRKKNGSYEIPNIRIHHDKSWYFKDAFVKLDLTNKTLTFDTMLGPVTVKYIGSIKEYDLISDLKRRDKIKFGGNYSIKQNCFIAAVKVPFKKLYEPTNFLGFDFNKTPEHWIVFNNNQTISMPQEIQNITQQIKELNKILNEKNKPVKERIMRSKQRRKIRLQWKELHSRLKKQCKKIAEKIIKMTINNNSLLVLDSVKGGQDLGTFGQDHIMPIIQTLCENIGIPFYCVPCKNTSKRCSMCGHIDAENRKTVNDFKCVSCGYTDISHKNASQNIADIGEELFNANVPFGNYSRNKKETIITKYGSTLIKVK